MACRMEDRISMATKRQVTLRFRDEYVRASKKQKGVILDRMCETLGIGRSTARRLLAQAGQHGNGAVPAARERPCRYSDQSRQLLVRVWVLMDMPCGKYLKAMLPQWLPVLRDCGELDAYDGFTFSELMAMSASTIDRYLKPLRDAAHPKGLAATRPAGELLRNSITIRKASDELDGLPGKRGGRHRHRRGPQPAHRGRAAHPFPHGRDRARRDRRRERGGAGGHVLPAAGRRPHRSDA